MAFYNEKEQLYLETYVLGVGLGACFQQVGDRMQFQKDEAPNNMTLWPIPFTSKRMTSAFPMRLA